MPKQTCPYCADAPENHVFLYFGNTSAILLDPLVGTLSKNTPKFLKNFAEWILAFLLKICLFLRLARFSQDIEKSATLRSKVVWEEAKRRGIEMEQAIVFSRPTEHFRVKIGGKYFYFESLPLPGNYDDLHTKPWDNKFFLKKHFSQAGIPVPRFLRLSRFSRIKPAVIFEKLKVPLIVKPAVGSRGRHTTTNIHTKEDLFLAIEQAFVLAPLLALEEHLEGFVCRATFVDGELVGFYRGEAPFVMGDGSKSVLELIAEKNSNRPERVSAIEILPELEAYLERSGFRLGDVLPQDQKLYLTHRTGRYFGGRTREMLSEVHPSFIPILTKAAHITGLPVLGFDCIIPDPEASADGQRWGIIECNTLPFIDLHYFAFEGKREKNIAGAVWDLYLKNLI